MNHQPLVSILIPNYNKAPYLSDTLDSVLAQTYTNWECIIVDDHSTDHSWEILESYAQRDSRIKIFRRPENRKKGGNAARNFAFEKSNGEFINWLDSDDIILPRKIERQLNQIMNTNSDIVLAKIKNGDSRLPIKNFTFELDKNKRPIRFLKGDFWFATSIPIFRRKFLNQFDLLFNEDLMRNQESEFFTRILLKKPEMSFIDEVQMIRVFDSCSIYSKYKKLSEREKIKLDYPIFLRIAQSYKSEGFWGNDEKMYFVDWFIRVVQYSEFEIEEYTKLFYLTFLYGNNHQRLIFIKSILYKILLAVFK